MPLNNPISNSDLIEEGVSNLYHTNTRVDARIVEVLNTSAPQTLHNSTAGIADGNTIEINSPSVILDASGYYYQFECMVSTDGVNWSVANAVDVATGIVVSLVMVSGRYVVDTVGVSYLKCPVKYSSLSLTLSATPTYVSYSTIGNTARPLIKTPDNLSPFISETDNLYLGTVTDVFSVGEVDAVYGFSGAILRKSVDWGTGFSSVNTFPTTYRHTVAAGGIASGVLHYFFISPTYYSFTPNEDLAAGIYITYTSSNPTVVTAINISGVRTDYEVTTGETQPETGVSIAVTSYAATVNFAKKISNGKLLVGVQNGGTGRGELWLSDASEANFAVIKYLTESGTYFSMWFGRDFYDNICLVAEYGTHNKALRVYLSQDYGETWSTIYTAATVAQVPGTHIHDVKYDPYSNLIWISIGDGINSHNVYWSSDMGANWNAVYEVGQAPSQFTQIAPLPNCVLFMSDSTQHMAVFRWDRTAMSVPVRLSIAYLYDGDYNAESPIASMAAIRHGTNAAVYFGWLEQYAVAEKKCPVFGTANGYDFYILWESAEVPTMVSSYVGVNSIAISANGNIAIATRTHEGTNAYHLIRLAEPTWLI